MAWGDLWSNKKYPDGCRNCGQTEKKHAGLGLCQNCYRLPDVKEAARNNTLETRESENVVGEEITESQFGAFDSVLEESTDFEPEIVSGERRPGSLNSPVTEPSDVSPDVESPTEKVKGFFKKKKPVQDSTYIPPRSKEKPPKGVGRRHSTAETLEDIWSAIGGLAIRTGRHAPLGRYLTWQAPAAGEMLDQALNGSFLDRKILQPAVKTRSRLDMVIAVMGPPGIIFAIEQNPARAAQLMPMLKSAIRSSLPTLLPAMKKAQAREEKINKAVAEAFGEDFPPGVDPVDAVIESMFSGWYVPPTVVDEPETENENAETHA